MFKRVFIIIVYIFAMIGFGLVAGFFAVKFGWTNTSGVIDTQRDSFLAGGTGSGTAVSTSTPADGYWNTQPEWLTIRDAIKKDKTVIYQAATVSGVSPRMIVTQLVAEQLRLFNTERQAYKNFFAPLKVLGSQTQFSWGVMGVKEETALQIESHLKDTTSPYYPGPSYEHLLDFKTADVSQERFARMTDDHNHYYSYLYAGLYLKQVTAQWKSAGFDISHKPDILATLYNIGFAHSKPNANPGSGGAEITIGDKKYSFGSIGAEFYNSSELLQDFPRE